MISVHTLIQMGHWKTGSILVAVNYKHLMVSLSISVRNTHHKIVWSVKRKKLNSSSMENSYVRSAMLLKYPWWVDLASLVFSGRGNDGLTASQRKWHARKFKRTIGRRLSKKEMKALRERAEKKREQRNNIDNGGG